MAEREKLQASEYARLAVDIASDGLASDIVMLDIGSVSDFADYFVILTAGSRRQLRALAEDVEHGLERTGATLHHREGTHESGWMLLDFGDVIIHLFGPEERDFYGIDQLWARGTEIVRIQ